MAFIREGVSCSLICSTVEWAAVGSLSFLPGVLDTISAEPLWRWEANSQTRDAMSLWCPLSLGRPPKVRNLMRISQRSLEVSDASSFRRKLRLVSRTPGCCCGWEGLTHGSQPPPAFQREAMLSLVPLPPLIPSRWAGLLPPLHSTQPAWETSATPLASVPVSGMINSNVVSPALTSSFSKQTR